MKRIWIDVKGRNCDGCTKCCEGYLVTTIAGHEVGPGKPCKFMRKTTGCQVYLARPYDPCKTFQCHWKENTRIPDWMKPDKANVILLLKRVSDFNYIRIVRAGIRIDPRMNEWIQEQVKLGLHFVDYDDNDELVIYTEKEEFKEAVRKSLKNYADKVGQKTSNTHPK
jgi:hypothetical protein